MFEGTITEEITEIDERAFSMAASVARTPSLRPQLRAEAARLGRRLTEILNEIENLEHVEYTRRCYQISEALRDLIFVEKDSTIISNRLARELSRPKDY
jgi:hypothetical protein